MAPSRRCQFYLFDIKDADGEPFNETKNYRLSVPPDVPITQYWSATLYDRVTHALIRDVSHASRSSQFRGLVTEPDGSVVSPTSAPLLPMAPIELSSGRRMVHRLSTAREPTAATTPSTWPPSPNRQTRDGGTGLLRAQGGRRKDQRKCCFQPSASDNTSTPFSPPSCLPLCLYRRSGRTPGDDSMPCAPALHPRRPGSSAKSLPNPRETLRRRALRVTARLVAPGYTRNRPGIVALNWTFFDLDPVFRTRFVRVRPG